MRYYPSSYILSLCARTVTSEKICRKLENKIGSGKKLKLEKVEPEKFKTRKMRNEKMELFTLASPNFHKNKR